MDTKTCRICGLEKPLDGFHRLRSAKDGHHSACKPCSIAAQNRSRMKPKKDLREAAGGFKQCASCKSVKPDAEFVKNRNYSDGLNHICKMCLYPRRLAYEQRPEGKAKILEGMKRRYWASPDEKRDDRIERSHGLPRNTRAILLEAQGGVCAICGAERSAGGRRLSIDHDHSTGAIRGLLCTWCNQSIGQLRESPELLRKASCYLENPPASHLALTSVFVRKSKR